MLFDRHVNTAASPHAEADQRALAVQVKADWARETSRRAGTREGAIFKCDSIHLRKSRQQAVQAILIIVIMKKPTKPSWANIKGQLSGFDRAGLLGLVQHLYAANKDNQAFLHARFGLGDDVLKPYKNVIDRWLWQDVFKNHHLGREGEEGDLGLPESHWTAGRAGGTHGVLLRTGRWILRRHCDGR